MSPRFAVQWEAPCPPELGGGTRWVVDAEVAKDIQDELTAERDQLRTELDATNQVLAATGAELAGAVAEIDSIKAAAREREAAVNEAADWKLSGVVAEILSLPQFLLITQDPEGWTEERAPRPEPACFSALRVRDVERAIAKVRPVEPQGDPEVRIEIKDNCADRAPLPGHTLVNLGMLGDVEAIRRVAQFTVNESRTERTISPSLKRAAERALAWAAERAVACACGHVAASHNWHEGSDVGSCACGHSGAEWRPDTKSTCAEQSEAKSEPEDLAPNADYEPSALGTSPVRVPESFDGREEWLRVDSPITALLGANREVRRGQYRMGALRGAPSHTGAALLNALEELGWKLQRGDAEEVARHYARALDAIAETGWGASVMRDHARTTLLTKPAFVDQRLKDLRSWLDRKIANAASEHGIGSVTDALTRVLLQVDELLGEGE